MTYHQMDPAELRAFLTAVPAHTGVLATVRADGRPHAAPVWFMLQDDGTVLFNTNVGTVKGRNLRRERRAVLCVEDERPPFAFASIEGPVELVDDVDEVRASAHRIAARYVGTGRAEEFASRNVVPGELLVCLRPDKVTSAADLAE